MFVLKKVNKPSRHDLAVTGGATILKKILFNVTVRCFIYRARPRAVRGRATNISFI